MQITRFDRTPAHPAVALAPQVTLTRGRAHEVCGLARRSFALWLAGRMEGPVFWIAPGWSTDQLNPPGMCAFAEPGRFTFLAPQRETDLLWALEEVLRAGAVPLVVADLPSPPGLTAVRRMHLAAQTGAAEGGGVVPLALLLTPGEGGAPGVETRWHMAPAHPVQKLTAPGAPLPGRWRLVRRRARTAPEAAWWVTGVPGALSVQPLGAAAA